MKALEGFREVWDETHILREAIYHWARAEIVMKATHHECAQVGIIEVGLSSSGELIRREVIDGDYRATVRKAQSLWAICLEEWIEQYAPKAKNDEGSEDE